MIEHHIQKDIIERLAKASELRFSELKSDDLESNAFMYHLKQLIKQDLIEKSATGYRLSDSGLMYIDSFSFHTHKLRKQPKVISILAIKRHDGKYLLAKRKYQPYIGQYMFVSGKQHFGEPPEAHAIRELKEKLNFTLPLTQRGLADIRIYHGESLITHIVGHIYEGEVDKDVTPAPTSQFDYEWESLEDSTLSILAGTRELFTKLQQEKNLFFLSLDTEMEQLG